MECKGTHSQENKDQMSVMQVSQISLCMEATLTVFKMIAGILGVSGAMISDAIHSASDVLSTIVVMIGVKMAGKEADEKHPYGHERMESVAALLLAIALAMTGLIIGYQGLKTVGDGAYHTIAMPKTIALVAAVFSILTKEAMFWYARYYAKKHHSSALLADAWHHRSDAMSSIGSFIGIYGARRGILVLEPIASVVISLFIIRVAYVIFRDSINEMMDCCGTKEAEEKIKELTLQQTGVEGICVLKTRQFGTKLYVDLEIYVDCEISLDHANHISTSVHDAIEEQMEIVKHVMVRVVPNSRGE